MKAKSVMPGFVLMEIDDSNEYVKFGDGKLFIDTSFEPQRHAQSKGVIVKAPDAELLNDYLSDGTEVRHKNILQPGDIGIFHYLCMNDAIANGRYFTDESKKKYIFIRYEELFLVMRGEKILPINGWVIVKPVERTLPKTSLHIPDIVRGKKSITSGNVIAVSDPRSFFNNHGVNIGTDQYIMPGDLVHFRDVDSVPVQYELHSDIGLVYRMKYTDCFKITVPTLKAA